jgi:hypothetical protein
MTETNGNKESCENLCNLVVRKRKMLKDERGQLSIDFLVGISLFILALVFMAHFIPGMFVPFQSETIDLNSVAYRTSVILVEDPGWWDNVSHNGEDWEDHITDTSRIGLAIDKEHPNVLMMNKITGFENCTDTNLTRQLGLYRIIGGNRIDYGYNITLQFQGDEWGGTRMRGKSAPSSGDVVKMKRTVSVIVSGAGGVDASNLGGASDPVKPLLVIDGAEVPEFCTHDLYISITNFSFPTPPGPPGNFVNVKIVQTNLSNEPDDNLTVTANGLHIKMGSGLKLNDPLDGYRQVKNHTGNITVPMGGLVDNADINFANDTLMIRINKSAWLRAGIVTSPGADDVVIEINLNKIDCKKVTDPADLLRYSTTEAISLTPVRLIIQVWT